MLVTNKTWCAGLISLGLALAAPVSAEEVTAKTVVATVGGVEITVGHMIVAKSTLPAQYQALEDDVLWQGIYDQLVQQNALAQSLGDGVTEATQLTIDNQVSGLLAGEALGKRIQAAITDDVIQQAYEERFADAEPSKEFNAAHILLETEEDAKAVKSELDAGAEFGALAREKSTGPSGPNGGALGWFSKGMMVPEFEEAVLALEPGQVSEPVKTQFGWHVVVLNETRMADAPPLDEVRDDLVSELENEVVANVVKEVMDGIEIVKSEAEIDPSVLSDNSLIAE
ncbi:peptidyl-prolyl cis-trans isomerase C [Aliiruegeria haliotis]|uniref:Parvulin-like PPIase n=1 Tax=Aliiruegeria haliotis TaxID=1280846 RepID=A0A2T0RPI9_9RHOB|nr:peptidylprolyl isomerase [Aliiruegeria haliotis]PRY23047.1 peptidyl-prolyl cis-trans isomerase C [Aliiruegeria haliotis]